MNLILSPSLTYSQEEDENIIPSPTNSDIIILDIPNITVEESVTGLTSVDGMVQNNSTENAVDLKINVTLFDAENKTIRDTNRFVSAPFTVYEPNSTERFSFLMSVEEFENYAAIAYAERTS
ncbi:MAG TPA: hypothetical protein VD815_04855 [Candidatus Saccharimonadales bacterium]|nr:hypothetical protein [Candidatus Saccharimonadales bacterium]